MVIVNFALLFIYAKNTGGYLDFLTSHIKIRIDKKLCVGVWTDTGQTQDGHSTQ